MQIDSLQTVFMLFFAISWGAVANVQPRWHAFQWPLFFRVRQARHRCLVAFALLNLLPMIYFGYTLGILVGRGPPQGTALAGALHFVVPGVIPAFFRVLA